MKIDTKSKGYIDNVSKWTRARDCFAGSDAVKSRGADYLPMLDSHKRDGAAYEAYKLRALFYNATGRTIEGLSGFVFQKDPTVTNKNEELESHLEDITYTGVDATTFALWVTQEILITGRFGILVDMLEPESENGQVRTGEVLRPYWTGYQAEDILSWREERVGNDPAVLTRVVLRETNEESDLKDPFVIEEFTQYRILELVNEVYQQSVWRKKKDGEEFIKLSETTPMRKGSTLNRIPFVFVGPTNLSTKVSKPPLFDLVETNLSHYRTMADLEHGRHFVAIPTPWVSGLRTQDDRAPISLGPSTVWDLENGGQAGMLEFSGSGLAALVTAEQDKRKMMAVLGARLLEDQASVAETATAILLRHSGEGATLRTMTKTISWALTKVFQWHAWWFGTEAMPKDTEVAYDLNQEFFSIKLNPQEVQVQLQLLQSEAISFETFYYNLTVGGWTRPGVDSEEERKKILEEGGSLMANETDDQLKEDDEEPKEKPEEMTEEMTEEMKKMMKEEEDNQ